MQRVTHFVTTFFRNIPSAYLVLFTVPGIFIGYELMRIGYRICITLLTTEDEIVEWGTFVVWLLAGIWAVVLIRHVYRTRNKLALVFFIVVALGSFFVAGEELSWGQRLFNVDTPEWLETVNQQSETNLHNLLPPGLVKEYLPMLIFGFGVVVPIMAIKSRFPAPSPLFIPTFLVSAFMAKGRSLPGLVNPEREVGELVFGISILLFLFVEWQKNQGKPPTITRRGLVKAVVVSVIAIPTFTLIGGLQCERRWCQNPDKTYAPVVQRLRADLADNHAILSMVSGNAGFDYCRIVGARYNVVTPVIKRTVNYVVNLDDALNHLDAYDELFVISDTPQKTDPDGLVEDQLLDVAYPVDVNDYRGILFMRYGVAHSLTEETITARFGSDITMLTYAYSDEPLTPGGVLEVALIFTAEQALAQDYTVSLQLLDATQKPIAQRESIPRNGRMPTSSWLPGETIVDHHGLALPDDLPLGTYTLQLSLHDGEDQLSVQVDGDAIGNVLPLAEMVVENS